MTILPTLDRLLIKPIEEDTENQLIIPDQAKEKPQKGEVIAIGETVSKTIKKGDIVYYRKGGGMPFPGGLLMMRYGSDVIAVVDPLVAEASNTI